MTVAVAFGLIFSIGYLRLSLIRQFVSWLTPGLLFFPVWFLSGTAVLDVASVDRALTVPRLEPHSTTPILMVVFDQLPLVSLLDNEGQIDPIRYPNFSKLAGDSIWYRNATAVSDRTGWALPALLTGNYPDPKKLPVSEHHPNNLLTLFSQSHQVYSFEPITRLCPTELCSRLDQPRGSRTALLLADLWILYLHLLLPSELAESLPRLTRAGRTWPKELPKPGRTYGSSGEIATVWNRLCQSSPPSSPRRIALRSTSCISCYLTSPTSICQRSSENVVS